jgi:TolB-like protein
MTRKDSTGNEAEAASAARRFVSVDAGEQGADVALASWLAERPEHERALERVELAVVLARRLAAEPDSPLHAEAAAAAGLRPRRRMRTRALAWSSVLAAAVLLAVILLPKSPASLERPELAPLAAAERVTVDAPRDSVAMLPTGVVVDASAVAVLPFAGAGDATLARGLERDVAAALRTVPGLYIIADDAVRPYAASDLAAAEIGSQLGVRGLVDAAVELGDGRVRVSVRLREAATDATLWQTDLERPIDDLGAMRDEIAESVADAMLDPGVREQLAVEARSRPPMSFSKPLQQ